jgi:cell division protein FtsB
MQTPYHTDPQASVAAAMGLQQGTALVVKQLERIVAAKDAEIERLRAMGLQQGTALVVKQLERIVAAKDAEIERLRAALERLDHEIFHDPQEIERAGHFRTIIENALHPELERAKALSELAETDADLI